MTNELELDLIEELKDMEFGKLFGAESARSEFGLVLYKNRQKAGLTQSELAAHLGVSQPYIAKLERGEANPTLGSAGKIFAVLGLRLEFTTAPLSPQTHDSHNETYASGKPAYPKKGINASPSLVSEKKKKYR